MTRYYPNPVHDANWWGSIELINPLGVNDKFGDLETENIAGKNWLAFGNFIDEPYAPPQGYRVVFPTSTDCLLYIRWVLLPYECDNDEYKNGKEVELFGKPKEIADIIDQAPDETSAEEMIVTIREETTNALVNCGFEIYTLMSGQDYLNDLKESSG